jgi:mitochondrial import receptor subunit TOM70
MAPIPESNSDSIASKITNFISENKKVILLGSSLAVVAAGGTYYYLRTRSYGVSGGQSSELPASKSKDKKKRSRKKKTGAKDVGPLLEDRKPKVEEVDLGQNCYS